jgi:DNA-binding NarL/FixJ family response regulator
MTSDARLLLVDGNDDFLDGLSAWIAACRGFQAVGVAHSANEAFERIVLLAPDMVLMDVTLPDMNGLDATRRIKSRAGAPLVILMTFLDSAAARAEAKAAGADGCLSKSEITDEFSRVVGTLWRLRLGRPGWSGSVPGAAQPNSRRKREIEE